LFSYLGKNRKRHDRPKIYYAFSFIFITIGVYWYNLVEFEIDQKEVASQFIAAEALREMGLKTTHQIQIDRLYIWHSATQLRYKVKSAGNYVFIAVCDYDCRDVNLALYDSDGKLMSEDVADNDQPLLYVNVPREGTFSLEVTIPDCRAIWCTYGVAALQHTEGHTQSVPKDDATP
jgi:hypothetical protein